MQYNRYKSKSWLAFRVAAALISLTLPGWAGQPDFDGNGSTDILWRNYATGENSIWLMNGLNPISFVSIQSVPDLNWEMAGSGDFDGDGKPDILWRNHKTGENSIWLMSGTSPRSFVLTDSAPNLQWQIGGVGDFNGDGKPDILWRNDATGENSIWLMDGTKAVAFVPLQTVSELNWQIEGVADFNHDGHSDILWRNYKTGQNSIWLMDGTHPTSFLTIHEAPNLDWQMVGAGDFNGDGKPDILWRNFKTGENSVWTMDMTSPTDFTLIQQVPNADWQIAGTRSLGHDISLLGKLQCSAPDGPSTSAVNPIPFANIRAENGATVGANETGVFRTKATLNKDSYALRIFYEGVVPTNLFSGATPLQVMDDGHNTRSDTLNAPIVASNPFSSDLGLITLNSVDCEAWRIGALALSDYHLVRNTPPPAGRLRIKRWENVLVGTPLTYYDYITIPTDFMTDTESPTSELRVNAIFHEFGHSVRHVADGSQNHWNDDNVKYIYAQDHDSNTLHNKGFAFNEGWGDFWEQARPERYTGAKTYTHQLFDPGCVVPTARDFNEASVANRLIDLHTELLNSPKLQFLMNNIVPPIVGDARNNFVDSFMVGILIDNPGQIHSLHEYLTKVALQIPSVVPGDDLSCPSDFHDDGVFCRRDAKSISKPSSGICPCGFHDHGPTCFRNTLIFRDF